MHRSIFFNQTENRKVIQIFDSFLNIDDFNKYSKDILHILSRISLSSNINYKRDIIIYFNAACGYGFNNNNLHLKYKYFSSEGMQDRLIIKPNTLHYKLFYDFYVQKYYI